jgi:hypothetical protein
VRWGEETVSLGSAVLAGERLMEVIPPLAPLVPGGGLRRGTTVEVPAGAIPGATSLALSLLAGPSAAGRWLAAVGLPDLGLVAAAQLGIHLDRLAVVAHPGAHWSTVTAALIDSMDAVLLRPPPAVGAVDARRLVARTRERGAVLVVTEGQQRQRWPQPADLRLAVVGAVPHGPEAGHGHFGGRWVEVEATGRGEASRPRRVTLWLPAGDGRVMEAGSNAGDAGVAGVGRVMTAGSNAGDGRDAGSLVEAAPSRRAG